VGCALHIWISVVSDSIAKDSWKKRMLQGRKWVFTIISVQQSSFEWIFNNLGILLIQHLRRVVPRPEVLLVPENRSSLKRIDLKGTFKKSSKCVCTTTVVPSPDPLYYTP